MSIRTDRSRPRWTGVAGVAVVIPLVALVAMAGPATALAGNWLRAPTAPPPGPRAGAAAAYDPNRGQLVMFGGTNFVTVFRGTYTWNGFNWTLLPGAPAGPLSRTDAMMAYDPIRDEIVMFGGTIAGTSGINETWIWDGSAWSYRNLEIRPPGRAAGCLSYDPSTGNIILFGGTPDTVNYLNDTWSWDGFSWTQLFPAVSPSPRAARCTFDQARNEIMFFGGLLPGDHFSDQTWTWNGSTWTQESPATRPQARIAAGLDYVTTAGQVLMFGGASIEILPFPHPVFLDDTWSWNGTNWSEQSPSRIPPERADSAMAYFPPMDYTVLFGGQTSVGGAVVGDTWGWR